MSVGSDTLSGAASGAALGTSILPGWGTAIGAVGGAVVGLISGEGKKKKRDAAAAAVHRPDYQIPQEVFQNQAMYQAMANSSRVPGQSQIENNINQNTSQALNASQKAAGSSADALAAVGNIQQNANNEFGKLGIAGAQLQLANKDKLAQANNDVADYRQQAFDYNQNQPYQIAFAQNQKLQDQNRQDNQNTTNDVQQLSFSLSNGYSQNGNKKKSANSMRTSLPTYDYTSYANNLNIG